MAKQNNQFNELLNDMSAKPQAYNDELFEYVYDIDQTLEVDETTNTALKLDRYSKRRGTEWTKTDDGQKVLSKVDDDQVIHVSADLLATAWEPSPQLSEKPAEGEPAKRAMFLKSLMESPKYQSLHRSTRLDNVASELAAASFAKGYYEYMAVEQTDDDLENEINAGPSIDNALDGANKDVNELNDAREALGDQIGKNPGQGGSFSADQVRKTFLKIRGNCQLRKIMEHAGRWRRLAKSMQMNKLVHGQDEVVGFDFGDNLFNILPSELIYLDDELLELEFLRKYVERTLLIRDLKAKAEEKCGPIVVNIDESGSMEGDRIVQAKAMALAMTWIAEHQNRWICLSSFSSKNQGRYLVIEPGKKDSAKLLSWLGTFYNGGTDADYPLETLPSKWEEIGCPKGKTDIITITDGYIHLRPEVEEYFMNFKAKNNVKMTTIVIGCSVGPMAKVSDKVIEIGRLGIDSDGITECLSI